MYYILLMLKIHSKKKKCNSKLRIKFDYVNNIQRQQRWRRDCDTRSRNWGKGLSFNDRCTRQYMCRICIESLLHSQWTIFVCNFVTTLLVNHARRLYAKKESTQRSYGISLNQRMHNGPRRIRVTRKDNNVSHSFELIKIMLKNVKQFL